MNRRRDAIKAPPPFSMLTAGASYRYILAITEILRLHPVSPLGYAQDDRLGCPLSPKQKAASSAVILTFNLIWLY